MTIEEDRKDLIMYRKMFSTQAQEAYSVRNIALQILDVCENVAFTRPALEIFAKHLRKQLPTTPPVIMYSWQTTVKRKKAQ